MQGHKKGGSPNSVRPSLITLTKNVKQEQVHIIEERLVVQEQLCQVAQVLAEHFLLLAINLKHGDIGVPVDLVSWRMLYTAPFQVLQHLLALLEKGQVILTEVQHLQQHKPVSMYT